ncbi:heme/steroid binding protein-like protein [Phyllosticta citrichinensis]|uniref:Heme/steroid binding protein-like protein n=1 Tax=Phyllosticta citrichinensis TaxID=1130410 RepID=A0ABR1Y081_9PEZI
MLFGISLLLVSATFLFYRHPPTAWLAHFLRQLSRRRMLSGTGNQDAPDGQTRDDSSDEPQVPDDSQKQENGQAAIKARDSPVANHGPSPLNLPKVETVPSDKGSESPTTPKATAPPTIPSFSLATSDSEDTDNEDKMPPPQFPAVNSAQRASGSSMKPPAMKPPTLKPLPKQTASQLMPPPPRLPQSSLRVPSSGPVPNRGRPAAPSSNSLGIPATAPVKTPNPRQKVQLTPGHSPLDWAALVKSNSNLSGVSSLQRVTPSMLKAHNGRRNKQTGQVMPAWSAYQGKVYNITPYLPYHPGGEGELRRAAGKDGEKLFNEVHPWVNWDNMLSECVVGILVPEPVAEETTGSLDDMD